MTVSNGKREWRSARRRTFNKNLTARSTSCEVRANQRDAWFPSIATCDAVARGKPAKENKRENWHIPVSLPGSVSWASGHSSSTPKPVMGIPIGLGQWFLNFFERDPNLSFMNISRPKPQTSNKCIFNINTVLFFQICMKWTRHRQPVIVHSTIKQRLHYDSSW